MCSRGHESRLPVNPRGLGTAAAATGARGRGVVVFSVGNQVGMRGTLCPMGDSAKELRCPGSSHGRGGAGWRGTLPGSTRWLCEAEQNFQEQKLLQRRTRVRWGGWSHLERTRVASQADEAEQEAGWEDDRMEPGRHSPDPATDTRRGRVTVKSQRSGLGRLRSRGREVAGCAGQVPAAAGTR